MTAEELEKLKFPIGHFQMPAEVSQEQIDEWIGEIESFPSEVFKLIAGITSEQVSLRYRPGSWMVHQVVHHCVDSHMNSIIRFKLALTEDLPVIKPYLEAKWMELPDAQDDEMVNSITLLYGIHERLGMLLRGLSEAQLELEFIHPEHGRKFNLKENIGIYAWHGNHHLAHIRQALNSEGKYN